MKTLILTALSLSVLISASAHAKCSQETVTIAEEILKTDAKLYEDGLVSHIVVLKAQSALQDASLCAELTSLKKYCETKSKLIAEIQEIVVIHSKNGMGDLTFDFVKERIDLEQRCN